MSPAEPTSSKPDVWDAHLRPAVNRLRPARARGAQQPQHPAALQPLAPDPNPAELKLLMSGMLASGPPPSTQRTACARGARDRYPYPYIAIFTTGFAISWLPATSSRPARPQCMLQASLQRIPYLPHACCSVEASRPTLATTMFSGMNGQPPAWATPEKGPCAIHALMRLFKTTDGPPQAGFSQVLDYDWTAGELTQTLVPDPERNAPGSMAAFQAEAERAAAARAGGAAAGGADAAEGIGAADAEARVPRAHGRVACGRGAPESAQRRFCCKGEALGWDLGGWELCTCRFAGAAQKRGFAYCPEHSARATTWQQTECVCLMELLDGLTSSACCCRQFYLGSVPI